MEVNSRFIGFCERRNDSAFLDEPYRLVVDCIDCILSSTDFQHRKQVYRAYDCALGEKWKRTMIYTREVAFFSIYLENSYYLCHLFGTSELIDASYFASQNRTVIVWWNHEMYTKWNWPSLINNRNNLNFQTEPRQIINTNVRSH